MQQYLAELGELNQLCCTRFFQNAESAGIIPWYKSPKSNTETRAAVLFAAYDPWDTCFRMLPGSHRYFFTSLRHGLITNDVASLLQRRLLDACAKILREYDGYFSSELRDGRVGKIVQQTVNMPDLSLHEAYQNLFPDELFAAIPWPFIPAQHLSTPVFSAIGISWDEIRRGAVQRLNALAAAVDMVNFGPSMNLGSETIVTVLDWIEEGTINAKSRELPRAKESVVRISIPSLNNGFQGITLGIFYNLRSQHEPYVMHQLRQFGETIAAEYAQIRLRNARSDLDGPINAAALARSCIHILPPVQHVTVECDSDWSGYRLRNEHNYLAGHERLNREQIDAEISSSEQTTFTMNVDGQFAQIKVKMLKDCPGLDPVFTGIRLKSSIERAFSLLKPKNELEPLKRSELQQVINDLMRQIRDNAGRPSASKLLYLMDAALRNYERGKAVLKNHICREFMQKTLGQPVYNNYQVCGKAAKKYESDINRHLGNKFRFKPTGRKLDVTWRAIKNNADKSIDISSVDLAAW